MPFRAPRPFLSVDQYLEQGGKGENLPQRTIPIARPPLEAMLYQIYDWQRSAMEPFRLFAQAANQLYGHPQSPLSHFPGSRNVAAAFDLMTRLTQRYERPAFGIHEVQVGGR